MPTVHDLLTYIFDDEGGRLRSQLETWSMASRRFRDFAETYRDKIRKKVRGLRDAEGWSDLEAELSVAFLLLQEKRLSVEYEKFAAGDGRGPDFNVTITTRRVLTVEATRIRAASLESSVLTPRLMDAVIDKVGQTVPGMSNILVVVSALAVPLESVTTAMTALRLSAERKYDNYFTRRGFLDSADFIRQFARLSAVAVRQYPHPTAGRDIDKAHSVLWHNKLARDRVPRELINLLDTRPTTGSET